MSESKNTETEEKTDGDATSRSAAEGAEPQNAGSTGQTGGPGKGSFNTPLGPPKTED